MISKKYKEIIKKLEENIDNKETLEFVKSQISELVLVCTESLEDTCKSYEKKMSKFEKKLEVIEELITKIEKDFLEDAQTLDLEPICCPYCNFNFLIEYDSTKTEMKCPECENIISLDWGNDDI